MQDKPGSQRPMVLMKSDFDRYSEWAAHFDRHNIDIVPWEDREKVREKVRFALVWCPEPGSLAALPALEVVFSIGAGVDHLKGENMVPDGIPVVRMVQNSLTAGMVEYVMYQVLGFHRNMPNYARDQRKGVWKPAPYAMPQERTVGILGLGVLGTAVGESLSNFGFNITGWSRTPKSVPGIRSYHGDEQLSQFLETCHYLVCLLPNTPQTTGIINAQTLSALPRGACIINVGRGTAIVDGDLVAALKSGHIANAALDVFNQEPLPSNSPYWGIDNVIITPHIASMTHPADSAGHVARSIERHLQGKPLANLADLKRGY